MRGGGSWDFPTPPRIFNFFWYSVVFLVVGGGGGGGEFLKRDSHNIILHIQMLGQNQMAVLKVHLAWLVPITITL